MAYLFLNCLSFTSCSGNEALPIYQLNHPQKINLQHATTQPTDRTTDNQPPQNVLSIHEVRTYKRSKHSDKKSQLKELSEYIETGILFVIPPVRPSISPSSHPFVCLLLQKSAVVTSNILSRFVCGSSLVPFSWSS